MVQSAELIAERRGAVQLLRIANPRKRNALDAELCDALAAAFRGLAASGARSAVLTGEGDRAFCSGYDIDALPEPDDPSGADESPFDRMIDAMAATGVPIICALNGVALGGGCELAAACDLRIAHAGVRLRIPPARLGIVYPARGLARLSAIAGESRARLMFLAARAVSAEQAASWGLIDEIVEPSRVLPVALERATEVAALAPMAVQGMRRTFEALLRRRTELAPEVAAALAQTRRDAWRSEDAREARLAFSERRDPLFSGR